MKTYELYNLNTGEILADNLTFEDVPELFEAYTNFFPDNEIIVCYRDQNISVACVKILNKEELARKKFHAEWMEFMEELLIMDNIHQEVGL